MRYGQCFASSTLHIASVQDRNSMSSPLLVHAVMSRQWWLGSSATLMFAFASRAAGPFFLKD